MKNKTIIRCPRSLLVNKYNSVIKKELIPKNSKFLSDLDDRLGMKVYRLYKYFMEHKEFKGTKKDFLIICDPDIEANKFNVYRNFLEMKQISKIDFVLACKNNKGEIEQTLTRQIFLIEEHRKIVDKENKDEDLRVKSLIYIKPHEGTLRFFNDTTDTKGGYDYVRLNTSNVKGLNPKVIDLINRIYSYINYIIKSENAHKKNDIVELDTKELAEKIGSIKKYKKDRKRFIISIENALLEIEKASNDLKSLKLSQNKEKVQFEY
jgi:hypothetical protein